ncbi:uncharacterized protein BDV17DRAFT_298321 [Aspergillus undulatus]|uniref:uncharacterized protein n=1 Tax=Aspergillus undulatus TaxID=1810928 RepID=UPI003CCE52C3
MPDLTDLPVELLDAILSLAFTSTEIHSRKIYSQDLVDVNGLSRLLVNRKHHQTFLPRIYSHWTYNGARHPYSSLWKFLRTVVTNPTLAANVQVLTVGNWAACPPFYIERHHEIQTQDNEFQLTSDHEDVVKTAIQAARLPSELGSLFLDATFAKDNGHRDRRPLMALILANLPSAATIYGHIQPSDLFLWAIVRTALDQQQSSSSAPSNALSGLKELHLFSEVPRYYEGGPDASDENIQSPALKLDGLWPALYLQSLRTVRLYNLDPDGISTLFRNFNREHGYDCHIQNLHIVSKATSTCRAEDVTTLLTLPTSLKSLSFSWEKDKTKTNENINGKRRNIWQISNHEVWTAIQKHKHALEYLDVLHEFQYGARTTKSRLNDHFGSLTEFTKLRYLSILTEMLIGGYGGAPASWSLKDTLPANIETLLLPTWVCAGTTPSIVTQLEDITAHLPQACFRNRVRFSVRALLCNSAIALDNCSFPAGARCKSQWRKEYNLQRDGVSRCSLKTHVVPFQDHSGNHSFMVFESPEHCPLPPLINFNVYFTHPDGPLPDFEDLRDNLVDMYDYILSEGLELFHFRLDVYFLPNASRQDCTVHYAAEKTTRGDSVQMMDEAVEKLEADPGHPPPNMPRMPGMVNKYPLFTRRHYLSGLLLFHPERSWSEDSRRMCFVRFTVGDPDSSSEQWYGVDEVDSDGESEELGMQLYDLAWMFEEEPGSVHCEATLRGWTTW